MIKSPARQMSGRGFLYLGIGAGLPGNRFPEEKRLPEDCAQRGFVVERNLRPNEKQCGGNAQGYRRGAFWLDRQGSQLFISVRSPRCHSEPGPSGAPAAQTEEFLLSVWRAWGCETAGIAGSPGCRKGCLGKIHAPGKKAGYDSGHHIARAANGSMAESGARPPSG